MKKLLSLFTFLLITLAISAQTSAKKYVLLEHFTNSNCSICASRNPAFFNLISQAQYADDVHHVSIHPPYPYVQCVFYQHNQSENSDWAALYNIQGTPRVAVNGKLQPSSSQLLRADTLNKYVDQTSPLYLKVSESASGNSRNVLISAYALDNIPVGNYKLYAAVVEKTINMTTGNGESVHHNVFRKMLTPVDGMSFSLPASGQSATQSFNYTLDNAWDPNEVYVLAFIKEEGSKQVLNSGTKFDPVLTLSQNEPGVQKIQLFPNPANNITYADLGSDKALNTEVYALDGRMVYTSQGSGSNLESIPTNALSPGVYIARITGESSIYTAKFVKE